MYFLLNLSHYVKSYGHLCQILAFFYNARSPDMAMSRDPRSKFRKTLFFQILHLISGQVTKFLLEKRSTSVVISQKPHGGWPSAFRGKQRSSSSFHMVIYARSEQCALIGGPTYLLII